MAKFIEVTNYSANRRMSVNVDHIQYVDPTTDDRACINFNDDDYVEVTETYDDVMVLING